MSKQTPRERFLAACHGGEVDRRPILRWPISADNNGVLSDATVLPMDALLVEHSLAADDRVHLVEVVNPFGLALGRGLDLNLAFREDPAEGSSLLDSLVEEVKSDVQHALEVGADGVLYRLHGARAKYCSPMQYGGYYLDRDRELLESISNARLNMLFVVGNEDVYLDFVSDLPAHIFGWDSVASGISSLSVRAMRQGAQASADPQSEVQLLFDGEIIANLLEDDYLAARS